MMRDELLTILENFPGKRVLVVGDLMADEHIWGHVNRISPEAPVPIVEVERETFVPGGAANTAAQLVAFEATVFVAGVVGDDAAGGKLREALTTLGADVRAVVTATDRPTTRKTRVTAGSYQGAQQIVRVDREKRAPLTPETEAVLLAACEALLDQGCDALLFSDYLKGVLTETLVARLTAAARARGIVVTANPKPASVGFYKDADLIQLNRKEADEASRTTLFESLDDTLFHEAGARLREALEVRNLLVTRGARGLTVFEPERFVDVGAVPVEVFDGTGAGDSTIAGITMGLAAGGTIEQAVRLGNASGGAVVRHVGVVTARRDEVAALL
ncbi:bifunctional heptose 7-phosphate kinase/heptose 1-phosphate adenyltransferase [Armatimonas rosea]|uniref:D-beta-D-heptose 7-phosphate kinase/D-beta-D-heptose 1-phosphate adenosyltransferase n=1 Tax=Armatimonas rosea TaxID=685828 RepID=A0A7W9W965_ARMRO|nr:PfkB family carbohydrate kinase [Armatimonas rosea]MBB6052951.1 D-beta-D-heptose 7-phosphate kinase/D-beta-D-heptose 1-phosphate adenosyltransferase [Armatimonas rosea]